ncbi:hypothetical protein DdX_18137 [Ditylenchus destructor]|uniref:Uncharacterized protein n=1 Tax=Ditylenchus destructor TaxID=166010 RepID=A0AAD4MKG2_9BILA|nr:hypothetical protein DdX_18137 [Ditylenchus destructor]
MKKGVGKTNRSVVLTAVGSSQERLWALPVLVGKRNVQVKTSLAPQPNLPLPVPSNNPNGSLPNAHGSWAMPYLGYALPHEKDAITAPKYRQGSNWAMGVSRDMGKGPMDLNGYGPDSRIGY